METAGDRIRKYRESKRLTQAEFARELKSSTKYISAIETGGRELGPNLCKRLCDVMQISEQVLRYGVPKPLYSEPVQKMLDLMITLTETEQWELYVKTRKEMEK